MKRIRGPMMIIGIGVSVATWTGCSHLTVLRTEELRQVQSHVDSIGTQLIIVQTEIAKQQREQHELMRLIRADQQVRFGELENKISNLEGNISESQQRLTSIDQKTQEIKKRWEEAARTDSTSDALRNSEMTKLFQIAHDDFMARRYDLAVSGFKDIRTQYAGTPLAEDATYWVAECYYAQNKMTEAETAYKEYLKEFPNGKQLCTSLYKLGKIYEKQNKDRSREMVWGKLLERCPDAQEAKAAQDQMRKR